MGYSVGNLTTTRNYMLANGAALFLAFFVTLATRRLTMPPSS